MKKIKIYTANYCPYCVRAKELCEELGLTYEEIDITENAELRQELIAKTKVRTVPLIFIGDECIGGFTDLNDLHENNELQKKLEDQ